MGIDSREDAERLAKKIKETGIPVEIMVLGALLSLVREQLKEKPDDPEAKHSEKDLLETAELAAQHTIGKVAIPLCAAMGLAEEQARAVVERHAKEIVREVVSMSKIIDMKNDR